MKTSQFRIVSIGYVAENKEMGSKIIKITPIEDLSLLDGDIKSEPVKYEVSGKDNASKQYAAAAVVDNVISAEWLQNGSNRLTPPNVRRGMRVLIWQSADVDKYYWTSMGLDDSLMKLETVVYGWSATKDEGDTALTPKNSYYLEVSTHGKHILLSTSKANGEPFGYVLQINAKDGVATLKDDVGNFIQLDSELTKIILKNKDESSVILDKKLINVKALDTINIEAGKGIFLKCGASKVSILPAEIILKTPKLTGLK